MAKKPETTEEPKVETPEHDPFLSTASGIDERMAALREDHIKMGARDKGDDYKPRG